MADLISIETQGVSDDWAKADGSFETKLRGSLDRERVLSSMVHVAALATPDGDDICPPGIIARSRVGAFSFYGQGGALFSSEADQDLSAAQAVDMAFGNVKHAPPPPMPARAQPPSPTLAPAPAQHPPRRRRRMGWAGKFVMLLAILAFVGAVVMVFGVSSMQERGMPEDDILAAKTISGGLALIGLLLAALAIKTRKSYFVGESGQPVNEDGSELRFTKMAHNLGEYDSDDFDDGGDYDDYD